MKLDKDIFLVVGPSAAGKTEVLNDLRNACWLHQIPHVATAASDSHTILDRMREDDRDGGSNHTHNWCESYSQGHGHFSGESTIPFTVTSNVIPDRMYADFFALLARLPLTNQLRFAEWSGGVNTNPREEPASFADLSFGRIGGKLFSGVYTNSWIPRVRAIIHPVSDWETRFALNAGRGMPSPWQIAQGTASWSLSDAAMNIFGDDDFATIQHEFINRGVPVYEIPNDGDQGLKRELHVIKHELFPNYYESIERPTGGRRESET